MALHASRTRDPWLLVAGGFHKRGGMDRANAALAEYLLGLGHPLHVVAHEVDGTIAGNPLTTVYPVRRPIRSFLLGEFYLGRRGIEVAGRLSGAHPGTRVVVNGSNCAWPDVNWAHCVHRAWRACDPEAPVWFKAKNRIDRRIARRRERIALRQARVVVANSHSTRSNLLNWLGLDPQRVHTIYPGSDTALVPATAGERRSAREWLGISLERPLVVFVGTLGLDSNKGFDTLFTAWKKLCARPKWRAVLVAAGGGRGVERWRARAKAAGLADRVRMIGFTERVRELLAAADLLVSPVRYEAYGLNVQEAICAGVPAMVSACAGIAERYPPELRELLIEDPEDPEALAAKLIRWTDRVDYWKDRIAPTRRVLQLNTWERMAERFVSVVERHVFDSSNVRYGRRARRSGSRAEARRAAR